MRELIDDLKMTGFDVNSVSELRTSGVKYTDAVPVLLKWLPLLQTPAEKQEVVRALSVPWARAALPPLIEEFQVREPADSQWESLLWSVGNAIEVLWDDAYFDQLVELTRDTRLGKAREMVVLGMGKSKRSEASEVLLGLLDDPVVNGHAVKALGKLLVPSTRDSLMRMTEDQRAWVRSAARRALSKLDIDHQM